MTTTKRISLLALAAIVPAQSVGVIVGMMLFPDTAVAKTIFILTKIFMVAFPVWFWLRLRGRTGATPWSASNKKGIVVSIVAGIATVIVIVGAYAMLGDALIDKNAFVEKLDKIGLTNKWLYIGAMLYWICVNSLLEEFVWRWFVTERFAEITRPAAAVALSALCFTLHHILALNAMDFSPFANVAASAGVFVGGVLFSWLFVRYKSIWPPYIAHVFADIAVFGIGYVMLFR